MVVFKVDSFGDSQPQKLSHILCSEAVYFGIVFLPNSTPFRKHVEVATFWKLLPSAIDQLCFLVRFKKQRAFNKICSFRKKKEKTRKEVKGKGWHVFARNRWFKNSRTKYATVLTV